MFVESKRHILQNHPVLLREGRWRIPLLQDISDLHNVVVWRGTVYKSDISKYYLVNSCVSRQATDIHYSPKPDIVNAASVHKVNVIDNQSTSMKNLEKSQMENFMHMHKLFNLAAIFGALRKDVIP